MLPNLYNLSSKKNNQIKLTHCDDTKKMAHDSHIVRAKEDLKLSYGGPSQRQALGTNQLNEVYGIDNLVLVT